MRGRWLVIALLLAATPAHALKSFYTGFEFCDAVSFDSTLEEQYIFSAVSGDSTKPAVTLKAGVCATGASANVGCAVNADCPSSTCVPPSYCNANSGNNRGKYCGCYTNSDCEGSTACTGTPPAAVCASECGAGTCWTDPDNTCNLLLTPASGTAEAVTIPIDDATTEAYTHAAVRVEGALTKGQTTQVMRYTTNRDGCALYLEPQTATTYRLVAYWKDNTTKRCVRTGVPYADGKVCTYVAACNGGTNDGLGCDPANGDADCPSGTCDLQCPDDGRGEANCTQLSFGQTPDLSVGRRYEIVFGQEHAVDGEPFGAKCSLWESGFSRGAKTSGIGTCLYDGYACGANADCASRGTGKRCGSYLTDWPTLDPNGDAYCSENADCTEYDTQTCVDNDACGYTGAPSLSISAVTVGAAAAPTGSFTVYVDDILVDDNSVQAIQKDVKDWPVDMLTVRGANLMPGGATGTNNAFSRTGCTAGNEDECIDDLAAANTVDNATTSLDVNNGATGSLKIQDVNLTDITLSSVSGDRYTTDTTALDVVVGITNFVQDSANETFDVTKGKYYACMVSGGTETCSPTCANNTDCMGGFSNAYVCESGSCEFHPAAACSTNADCPGTFTNADGTSFWPIYARVQTNGAAEWTPAALNSAQMRQNYNKVGSASFGIKSTAGVVEVPIPTTPPLIAGAMQDVNGDGEVRLCLTGDSVANVLDEYIGGYVEGAQSIVTFTVGGTTLRDVANNIDDIMDGIEGGYMAGTAYAGATGSCDYLMIGPSAVNAFAYAAPPTTYCSTSPYNYCVPCDTNSDCATGTCSSGECSTAACNGSGTCDFYPDGYCRGGVNHGRRCHCPATSLRAKENGETYCLNNKGDGTPGNGSGDGSLYLEPNLDELCDDCATNADCMTNVACTGNTDCGAFQCVSNECQIPCDGTECRASPAYTRSDLLIVPSAVMSQPGCKDTADCPSGLCIATNSMAEVEDSLRQILKSVDGRACKDSNGGTCELGDTCTCNNNGNVPCNSVNAATACRIVPVLATEPPGVRGSPDAFGLGHAAAWHLSDSAAQLIRRIAKNENRHLVDVVKAYRLKSVNRSPEFFGKCTTNTDCAGVGQGVCFGGGSNACFTGTCVAGNYGAQCTTNSDCATCRSAYIDGIHPSIPPGTATGAQIMGELTQACFDNKVPCTANADCTSGTCKDSGYCYATWSDGICGKTCGGGGISCTTNTDCSAQIHTTCQDHCTAGLAGDTCATNTDCDLVNCQITTYAAVYYPLDWGSGFVANWRFEDASGSAAVDSGTANGAADNLTGAGLPAISTSVFVEGAKAVYFDQATDEYSSTSLVLKPAATQLAYGCFVRPTTDATWAVMGAWNNNRGWALQTYVGAGGDGGLQRIRCKAQSLTWDGLSDTIPLNQWSHIACIFVDGSVQPFVNATAANTTNFAAAALQASQRSFYVNQDPTGTSNTLSQVSYIDDCWMTTKSLGADATARDRTICRLCSMGVSGQVAECANDDATTVGYSTYKVCQTNADCNGGAGICDATGEGGGSVKRCIGYNVSMCNACELPACRAVAP